MKSFNFMRDVFKKFPLYLATNISLVVAESLIDAVSIFALMPVVDFLINVDPANRSLITKKVIAIFNSAGVPAVLWSAMALFLTLNILKIGFQIFARRSILRTKYAVLRDIILDTFSSFFNARWYFFTSAKHGTLINTFIHELKIVGDALGSMALFFANILKMFFYLAVPFYISWQVASVCLLSAVIFIVPVGLLRKLNYGLGKENTTTANAVSSVIHENINLAKIILGFGNQDKSVATLAHTYDKHSQAAIRSQILIIAIPLLYFPFSILVLMIGVFLAQRLALPLSAIAVLFYSLMKAMPSISDIITQKNMIDNFFPSYEQIMNLRARAKELEQPSGRKIFRGFKKELLLTELYFAYPGHAPNLSSINIKIPKGRMTAIVGESGSGKSTIIDIVMGFHEPLKGSVTIDGDRLAEFDISSYRHRVGYVPQDSILFDISIRDNLLWAKESASFEEIKHACRLANADEFINRFPNRYDTIVGNRGIRLSGGETQRIALARAILRKPDILILDEATSSLDTHSERLIQEAIENIAKETTTIAIAHRLSTIINADYIYVLKRGRIIEEGTSSHLISKGAEFCKMIQQQALNE